MLNIVYFCISRVLLEVQFMCSDQHGCFLRFIDFALSRYVRYKVQWSRNRSSVAQRMGRVIALLFHDRGTRRSWVVSSTPRPHFTPGKDPVPIVQEAGWAPGPVWTSGKSRRHWDSIPDRPTRSQSLYLLSCPVHTSRYVAQVFSEPFFSWFQLPLLLLVWILFLYSTCFVFLL